MNFLKQAFSETAKRYHASKVLHAASASPRRPSVECLELTEQSPELVVTVLSDRLGGANAQQLYAYLVLLEKLTDCCGFFFHLAMAQDHVLQENLVKLAIMRTEGAEYRQVRRAARLIVLDYSRMFIDSPELGSLAKLASAVEKITGKSLIRAIEVENKKVSFLDPRPEDIILISPVKGSAGVAPLRAKMTAWSCHVCTYVNASHDKKCHACWTLKPTYPFTPVTNGTVVGDIAPAAEILKGNVCHVENCRVASPPIPPSEDGGDAAPTFMDGEGNISTQSDLAELDVNGTGHST